MDTDTDLPHIRSELRRILSEVLGTDLSGVADDTPLLDYVHSSLALVEGLRRAYDRFGVLISIRRVLEDGANLAALSAYVDQTRNSQQKGSASHRTVPLAPSQQHVGFLAHYSRGAAAAHNEALVLRLEGPLNGPAFQAAVEAVAARHQALRTALSEDPNGLDIDAPDPVGLVLSQISPDRLGQRLTEVVLRPFEPGELLFRAELVRLAATSHVLALVGHALVVDQEALATVLQDIADAYHAALHGTRFDAAPAVQWTEHMAQLASDEARGARAAAAEHWQEVFADGLPLLELPSDRPRPSVKRYEGTRLVIPLDPDLEARLRTWVEAGEISAFVAVFASFTALLHRLSGQQDVVVGTLGRPAAAGGQRIVAPTRTLVLVRSQYDPERSFEDHVRAQAALLDEARRHDQLSLGELVRALNPPRDQSRSPLFSAAVAELPPATPPALDSLHASFEIPPAAGARYDIALTLAPGRSGTQLYCDYSTELFDADTVRRWLQGMLELLRAGIARSAEPCGQLPIMLDSDLRMLVREWNATQRPFPRDRTTLDLVMDQVARQAGQAAILFQGWVTTYTQLARRIEHIAELLRARDIGPGDRVGILLRRSPDLVASILAAWRVGALYVPMDPGFPPGRIAFMAQDAEVRTVIANRDLVELIECPSQARPLCIEDLAEETSSGLVGVPASPGPDGAYIMYTSGSTGQPKGIEIGHAGLTNFLLASREFLGFTATGSLLAITTVSFDISTFEFFVPLITGGVLVLGEEGLAADGISLAERIATARPSHVQATPSTWKAVLAAGWSGDPDLCIVSAGEALGRELAEQLLVRSRAVWNLYGPTETTVYSAVYEVRSAPGEPMRIGRPYPNTQLYVLDEELQPVPVGAVGELCIGGDGLARGYWRRPEMTAERFIPNPFRQGERMYRTGDLARHVPTGDVVCLGRLDDQVKVHGVRVELGEVEAALRGVPGIRDAVVTSWTDAQGSGQLVAHVLARRDGDPAPSEIRAQLRDRLPEPMIPPYVLYADRFPLTANGKIHRASLPPPGAVMGPARVVPAPPATRTERRLAEVWSKILGIAVDCVGRDDDFKDLGGHSLLMTQLIVAVRRQFQVDFGLREFFAASTLRAFAALLDERRHAQSSEPGHPPSLPARDSEWGKQRMGFLHREAQLPANLAPVRGLTFQPSARMRSALLTGATGFLGAYIVTEVLCATDAHLYCLVRPRNGASGKSRIAEQLRHYDLWRCDATWQEAWDRRVHVVEGDVILPRLGIVDAAYEALAREVDCIIHSAAQVNFIYPYEALRATNVLGVHEIIRFAFHGRIKPVHYLSTAAIWPMGSELTFYEHDSLDHGRLLNLGYDEAKWVAEQCLVNAGERGLPVSRYRPGEVGGDSETGRCVLSHFIFALLKGFLQFGAFPAVDTEVDVTPVDYVAKALVHLAFNRNPWGRAFHLTNPRRWHTSEAFEYLRRLGYQFEELPFVELRDRLLQDIRFADNALFPYQAALEEMDGRSFEIPRYDCTQTLRELEGSGIVCAPVDERLLGAYLRYLRGIGYLPEPATTTPWEPLTAKEFS